MCRLFLSILFASLLTVACEKPDLRLYPKDSKRKSTASGERVYRENCMSCHGEGGISIRGSIPHISASTFVNDDAGKVILSILYGSTYIEKQKELFHSSAENMDAYKDQLSDIEIMRLVNYLRTNFKNNAYMITSKDVKKARTLVW